MSKKPLLLVGWDGADWSIARPLMEAGLLPQLSELVRHGASGPICSFQPYLSPMLWNSISTGKHPAEHGIIGFTELNAQTGRIQPMSSRSRKVKALWNILSQNGLRTHVFGWFASHPAEKINGVCVSETFARFPHGRSGKVPEGSVHPIEMATSLADLRVAPNQVEVQLLKFFIPRIEEVSFPRDKRPHNTPQLTAGAAAWHRPEGIFAIAGPEIRQGVQITGAKLFDVTPTVLHAMGFSVGEDMDGRVLSEIFVESKSAARTIPSWDTEGPELSVFHNADQMDEASSELLKQFEDLGYVEFPNDPFETAEEVTLRQNAWNLGLALLSSHRLSSLQVYRVQVPQ